MRNFARNFATALSLVGFAAAISVASTGGALAQAKQQQMAPAPKQQAAPPQGAEHCLLGGVGGIPHRRRREPLLQLRTARFAAYLQRAQPDRHRLN